MKNTLNEINIYAFTCCLGGLLRIIASFLNDNFATDVLELFYIITDLCLILGLIGFYSVYRKHLFWLGNLGFAISICSIAFIAGPDTEIFNISAYQIGSPALGVGLTFLSINLISAKVCGLITPISIIASILIGLISMLLSNEFLFIITGLFFGFGFISLGVSIWQDS